MGMIGELKINLEESECWDGESIADALKREVEETLRTLVRGVVMKVWAEQESFILKKARGSVQGALGEEWKY